AISKFGKMTEIAKELQGLKVEDAKKKIIELLQQQGLVLKTIDIAAQDRPVNTYERSGQPVEFIVQPQWFIRVVDEKKSLIEKARKVKWFPESMRYRCENWIENLNWDWCVTRQRAFGVPIPAWYSE